MAKRLRTRDFFEVPLVSIGNHPAAEGDGNLTAERFAALLESTLEAMALGLRIPIKLGHEAQAILDRSGFPTAGWVDGIRRVGDTLVGDFRSVPGKLADLFEAGAWRTRSIETRPVRIDESEFDEVVTAVAMLGEELPADPTIDDFVALYGAEGAAAAALFSHAPEVVLGESVAHIDTTSGEGNRPRTTART